MSLRTPAKLTERFSVIERGRGLAGSRGWLFREGRAINTNTRFLIVTSGIGFIALMSEDPIKPATATYSTFFTNRGNERDWNDSTYAHFYSSGTVTRFTLAKYDLGSVFSSLAIIILASNQSTYNRFYVAVSSNDVTYTDIASAVIPPTTATWYVYFATNTRYIKLDIDNAGGGDQTKFYTVEAYQTINDRTFTTLKEDVLNIGVEANKYYQVLEVITL